MSAWGGGSGHRTLSSAEPSHFPCVCTSSEHTAFHACCLSVASRPAQLCSQSRVCSLDTEASKLMCAIRYHDVRTLFLRVMLMVEVTVALHACLHAKIRLVNIAPVQSTRRRAARWRPHKPLAGKGTVCSLEHYETLRNSRLGLSGAMSAETGAQTGMPAKTWLERVLDTERTPYRQVCVPPS